MIDIAMMGTNDGNIQRIDLSIFSTTTIIYGSREDLSPSSPNRRQKMMMKMLIVEAIRFTSQATNRDQIHEGDGLKRKNNRVNKTQ